jgi:DNA-binding winged helix-turn-helix (wHTH) protein
MTEHSLNEGEPHPMADSALRWIKKNVTIAELMTHAESLASCAIENNRLAEICLSTLNRLLDGKPVSDRYLSGLAWYLRNSKDMEKDAKNKVQLVPMTWEMLNSKAYIKLGYSASKALPYFIGKPKIIITHEGFYTSVFEFTYSEAQNLGFSTKTWHKCISELTGKGFIDPVWKGGLRGDGKSSSKFKMSSRWLDFGTDKFRIKTWD